VLGQGLFHLTATTESDLPTSPYRTYTLYLYVNHIPRDEWHPQYRREPLGGRTCYRTMTHGRFSRSWPAITPASRKTQGGEGQGKDERPVGSVQKEWTQGQGGANSRDDKRTGRGRASSKEEVGGPRRNSRQKSHLCKEHTLTSSGPFTAALYNLIVSTLTSKIPSPSVVCRGPLSAMLMTLSVPLAMRSSA
jgi:hypothetical protein